MLAQFDSSALKMIWRDSKVNFPAFDFFAWCRVVEGRVVKVGANLKIIKVSLETDAS